MRVWATSDWTAIDADTKLILAGSLATATRRAYGLSSDLADRLRHRDQLTTASKAYLNAVDFAFATGRLRHPRNLRRDVRSEVRYSPAKCSARATSRSRATPIRITLDRYIERSNLTLLWPMPVPRLTNGSQKSSRPLPISRSTGPDNSKMHRRSEDPALAANVSKTTLVDHDLVALSTSTTGESPRSRPKPKAESN